MKLPPCPYIVVVTPSATRKHAVPNVRPPCPVLVQLGIQATARRLHGQIFFICVWRARTRLRLQRYFAVREKFSTDTDSMLFVASEKGGLVSCPGGRHKMANGDPAVNAMTWKQIEEFRAELNHLNPYDRSVVLQILKIEDCNYDRAGNQHQLYGLAVSAKRYVVYTRHKLKFEIIKPSEHGLGIVYVPDERKRYKPSHCKDQKTTYPRWIVEAWERFLVNHFRNMQDSENVLVARDLWFGSLPAVMRIRVTTANVLKALRRHDPGAAKPYNFALSPILGHDGEYCSAYTSGLLLRRPIQAMTPFIFIGKEVERKAQEGGDISALENTGPIKYQAGQTINTRAADPALILRAKRFTMRRLMRESGVSQHATERFLRGGRLHPFTRARLVQAVEKLERQIPTGTRSNLT